MIIYILIISYINNYKKFLNIFISNMEGDSKIKANLKIVIIGDPNTGKSKFFEKYTKNIFDDIYRATIVAEFHFKLIEFDGYIYRLHLWDISGKDSDCKITKIFAKDAHGCIIMTDATNPKTRER